MFNPPICMLITWDSRNWQRLRKAVELCKDYGLTALSKRVYLGKVRKNELPELQRRLRQLFFGTKISCFFLCCANLVWKFLLFLWPSKQIWSGPESLK